MSVLVVCIIKVTKYF